MTTPNVSNIPSPLGATERIARLASLLDEVAVTFEKLKERLSPILLPEEVKELCGNPSSERSPLCKQINTVEFTLRNFDADLRSLLSRVDL